MLFDSGSSHNFIDQGMIKKLEYSVDNTKIFNIMIGDGELS